MKIETFVRRPFEVNVVQVTPSNAAEVAEWCGGKVGTGTYKLAGFDTQLNIVLVPGNGPHKGKFVEARLGYWVVEHLGKFRVYRNHQLHDMFAKKDEVLVTDQATRILHFHPGDLVESISPDTDGAQGTVVYSDQVLVEFGSQGIVLFDQSQLKHIDEFSERTKRIREAAERDQALEKINALRASAELEPLTDLGPVGSGGEVKKPEPVTEVKGMRVDSSVRVMFEHNVFYGETGIVRSIHPDGKRLVVQLDNETHSSVIDGPVEFLHSELELAQPDDMDPVFAEFHQDDTVEIVIHGHKRHGEIARVTVVGVDLTDGTTGIEVLFSDGEYRACRPDELKKI
jgi:hypothetical protein